MYEMTDVVNEVHEALGAQEATLVMVLVDVPALGIRSWYPVSQAGREGLPPGRLVEVLHRTGQRDVGTVKADKQLVCAPELSERLYQFGLPVQSQ